MKTKTCIFAILLAGGLSNSHAQDTWTQKADFGGTARRWAVGFSIGSKGYIGTGYDGTVSYNDFWEYDPSTNVWTQKASFNGARNQAFGFSIGSKGYIGMGQVDGIGYVNDFWEYDPSTNVWTQKSNYGGVPRHKPAGFSIGSKGYVGTGWDGSYHKDFWEYDPSTNTWVQKADFPGSARDSAVGFSIGNNGYIGTGQGPYGYFNNDFWEYNPSTNAWTRKANFGGSARGEAVGFSIGSKGYLGTGGQADSNYKNDFWEYDPATNTWVQKANFGGAARTTAIGFSVESNGYIGTGFNGSYYNDFWEYTPATAELNPVPLISQPLVPDAIVPGGAGFTLTVNGTGFVSGASVNWNGTARATTFVGNSQLTASILAADIATASTASVTVMNPSPGGGISNVVFFPITNPTSSVSLSKSDYATGAAPDSVATADFNGDGKLDLAVANFSDNTVSIFLGNGDGTFQAHVDYATGTNPSMVAVGDFNRDDKLDLAVANGLGSSGNTVSVLLGNGDGTFQAHVDYRTERGSITLAVGDFNGDGNLDIAVGDYGPDYMTGSISILLGNGDGSFQAQVSYAAGVNPVGVLVGDFNRDSKLDLAVLNNNPPFGVSILLGNGDGSFQTAVHYDAGTNPRVGMVADFNSDGNLDLAVANFLDNNLSILLGNGDGTFQTHVNYPAGTNPNALAGGDLNGDGKLDLVTANFTSNNVSVLAGNGNGTFQSHVDFGTGSGPSAVAIGDFNGDGRLDIGTANNVDNTVSVLLQVGDLTFDSAFSEKGPWDIDLPLSGGGVEDRRGGPHAKYEIYFVFNNNLTSVGSATTTCGSVASATVDPDDAHLVEVDIVNARCGKAFGGDEVTVTVNDLVDDQGNTLSSASITFCMLLGDVNGDGIVDSADAQQTHADQGQPTDSSNFREDVDNSGVIDAKDSTIVKKAQGTSCP